MIEFLCIDWFRGLIDTSICIVVGKRKGKKDLEIWMRFAEINRSVGSL